MLEAPKDRLEQTVLQLVRPLGLQFRQYKQDYYILQKQADLPKLKRSSIQSSHQRSASAVVSTVPKLPTNASMRAYEKTITGQVTDLSTDESLPGVNILVKGTSVGTVTDVDGNYRLTMPDDAEVLVFSSVGYTSEEVTIGNQTTIDVGLAPDIQSLSEVVVVGYGTQKKE